MRPEREEREAAEAYVGEDTTASQCRPMTAPRASAMYLAHGRSPFSPLSGEVVDTAPTVQVQLRLSLLVLGSSLVALVCPLSQQQSGDEEHTKVGRKAVAFVSQAETPIDQQQDLRALIELAEWAEEFEGTLLFITNRSGVASEVTPWPTSALGGHLSSADHV